MKAWSGLFTLALLVSACSGINNTANETLKNSSTTQSGDSEPNPLITPSPLYFNYPPFDKIKDSHFTPAMEQGMKEQLAEIEAIANQSAEPSFENTLVEMEKSGQLLNRAGTIFYSLISAHTNDALNAIEVAMAPKRSAHKDKILLNSKLFARVKKLYEQRENLNLDAESKRLIEKQYSEFVRAGAQLSEADKERLKAINAQLAELQTTFSQNVLKEVNSLAIIVDSREELSGLSEAEIQGAVDEAESRGHSGKFVIPLLNTSGQPYLSTLENRDLRKRIHLTSLSRGSRGGEFDNCSVLTDTMRLRAERAQLLGYKTHADYILEDQTAQTIEAVNERLAQLTPKAVANAKREASDLQAMIEAEGHDFNLASWDWAYYAEKVRQERYNFDNFQLRSYFELNNVLQNGLFFAMNKVYGLTFKKRFDLPVYQDDVRTFEVFDKDGSPLALFIADYYARPSKRGGAWMNAYVSQSELMGNKTVVANHLNIPEPPEGEPTLMTCDEVTTMFHEFGHAIHEMFSKVHYPYFSGTNVPRDFVEYPSQVHEMWAIWPEVLKNYAVHYKTGEAMPTELLDKVLATQRFNQGFATIEYLAASLLDQSWHQLSPEQVPDADGLLEFEAKTLQSANVAMESVPPRYRSTYFSHIMGGYSAGYYSYIWSEVLDADSVEWFKENGGMLRKNGDHFRETLLSRGGSVDAMTLFKNFRGAEPNVQPLLERRGLNQIDFSQER